MHWLLFIHKILFSSTCFEPQVLIFRNREWQYHMLHVYNCVLLKMGTWGSKHVEENSILWINNNQCIKVGNYFIVNSWYTVRKTSSYFWLSNAPVCLCEIDHINALFDGSTVEPRRATYEEQKVSLEKFVLTLT